MDLKIIIYTDCCKNVNISLNTHEEAYKNIYKLRLFIPKIENCTK